MFLPPGGGISDIQVMNNIYGIKAIVALNNKRKKVDQFEVTNKSCQICFQYYIQKALINNSMNLGEFIGGEIKKDEKTGKKKNNKKIG
jgi:hypothetical protein